MIGQTVSHYRILEKIGAGGMGEVYLAEDTSLDRKVALKFLPEYLQHEEIAHKRFMREAKSVAALDHPFICNIYEVSQTSDGHDFIVMEYVEGLTLQNKLVDGPLPLKEALRIATEVAEALEKAHTAGIVHRDLKPANIMLTTEGHAKVLDFGLAKKVVREDGTEQDISSALTREGSTLGTLAYMSPEQVKADAVDHRSDIFSFGIVLYEMLTGVHPFRKAQQAETISVILQAEPARLSRYIDEVPELLEHTVRKMLAKAPDERYQSAHEVRTELSEPLAEVMTSSFKAVVPIKKKPPWLPVSLGVIALILAALFVYWGWNVLRQPGPAIEGDRKSIAVLPFDNLSADPGDEYFSDGMTEEIIATLSRIGDLKVISRTSVMRYKDSDKPLREIAEELNVTTILEGSARQADGRVRITAQLIDAQADEHIWAETYDQSDEHVFDIQSDVAEQIATALRAELLPSERLQLARKPTENLGAYRWFLRGRHLRDLETPESLRGASECYQKAIEIDPAFADAYAGLAEAYLGIGSWNRNSEWGRKAEQTAKKALELDDNSPHAHAVMGIIQRDPVEKEREYKRALELDPGNSLAHREYGLLLLRILGRLDEAAVELQKALELDPVSLMSQLHLVNLHRARGELDDAMENILKTLELYPDSVVSYALIPSVYLALGQYTAAERWSKQTLAIEPDNYRATRRLIDSYLYQGRASEAKQLSERFLQLHPDRAGALESAAEVALWNGDFTRASEFYQELLRMGESQLAGLSRLQYCRLKTGDARSGDALMEEAVRQAEEQIRVGDQRSSVRAALARFYSIKGEKQAACKWLQEAIDAGWCSYDLAQRTPLFENLHDEPRFQQMMAEVKVKADAMLQRVEEIEREWDE